MDQLTGPGSDPRLEAAEMMRRRLASHPGATPGTRGIAESLVAALRRVLEDAQRLNAGQAATRGSDGASLDDLDARAGDLLGALAALHGVIVRRDPTEAARGLVEAARLLAEVRALEDSAQSAAEEPDDLGRRD